MGKALIICSAKGGVGKSTVTVNLGAALAEMGKKVTVLDGSLTTPDIGLHLAIPFYIKNLNEVVEGKASLEEATFTHKSGLKVIPTNVHTGQSLKWLDGIKLKNVLEDLKKENDFVLVDSAAGLDFTAIGVIKAADELLAIVNPEVAATINSYKSIVEGKHQGIKTTGLIINKHGKFENELKEDEILSVIGREIPLLGKVPEDSLIQVSQRQNETVINHSPKSKSSKEFKKIAAILAGEKYTEEKKGFLEKIFSIFKN